MPHLLTDWPQVLQRIQKARLFLLLSDYDGTLAPIVDRPELARLPQETKDALVKLTSRPPPEPARPSEPKLIIGIISARSLEDVSARTDIDGLIYAGNHGLEIRGPGLDFVHPEALKIKDIMDQAYRQLKEQLAVHTGAFAEHKGLSLTVHYRLVGDDGVEAVKDTVEKATPPFLERGQLIISPGKMALEIRPNISWHKGSAISTIQAALINGPAKKSASGDELVMYFGDDLPDEAAFATAQESGGMGIFVGSATQSTCAQYRLDSPREVGHIIHLIQQNL